MYGLMYGLMYDFYRKKSEDLLKLEREELHSIDEQTVLCVWLIRGKSHQLNINQLNQLMIF